VKKGLLPLCVVGHEPLLDGDWQPLGWLVTGGDCLGLL